jgi:hypothetical protein
MKSRKPFTIIVVLTSYMLLAATILPPLVQLAPIYGFGPSPSGKAYLHLNAYVNQGYAAFADQAHAVQLRWEADIYIDYHDGNGWVGPIEHLERITALVWSEESCYPEIPEGFECVAEGTLTWNDKDDLFNWSEDVSLAAEVTISLVQPGNNTVTALDNTTTEWLELWGVVETE